MMVKQLVGAVALAVSFSAGAATTTWDFNSSNAPIQGSGPGNKIEWTQNGVTMTLTAWSETFNDADFCNSSSAPECSGGGTSNSTERDPFIDTATLVYYQSGENLGIMNQDGESGSPQHSIDNIPNSSSWGYNDYDMVLAEFTASVNLTGIYSGWEASDSDVSVIAYTGAGPMDSSLFTSQSNTWSDLLSNGWSVVGNYANVANNHSISTAVESQYWLIGAYNPIFGGSLSNGNDGFKLGALSTEAGTPGTGVPEPSSVALMSLALAGLAFRRKLKK